jgi:hypothetical protein
MALKQTEQIMDAARSGLNTTDDIADVTGLSLKIVSAHVSQLIKDGRLRRTGRWRRKTCPLCGHTAARKSLFFEPAIPP